MTLNNYPLPLPLDSTHKAHLKRITDEGFVIASPGTTRFEELEHLVDRGILINRRCPNAMEVHQFEMSLTGIECMDEPGCSL